MTMPIKEICLGCPKEMIKFLEYTKNLSFEKDPDYDRLRGYLNKLAEKEGVNLTDLQFDWDETGFKTICDDPEKARVKNLQNSNVLEAYSAIR